MTLQEMLLVKLGEECNEVAQRVCKSLQFPPGEIENGQPFTNVARLCNELNDLMGIIGLCEATGVLPVDWYSLGQAGDKQLKVVKWLKHSQACGILNPDGLATLSQPEETK